MGAWRVTVDFKAIHVHVLVLRTVTFVTIKANECNLYWNWSVVGEESNLTNFNELPFETLTNYDIENDFIFGKRKFANLMNNVHFQTIITEHKYEQLFNPNQNYSWQYYDEGEFIIKNRNGDDFLNVFSLNIRSLPKMGANWWVFWGL